MTVLQEWWEDFKAGAVQGAVMTTVICGVWVAAHRPPRPVASRYQTTRMVVHHDCIASDAKGSCTSWNDYTTVEPVYVLVSRDGAECETGLAAYLTVRNGASFKCWQLFGWAGGTQSDEEIQP